MEAEPLLEWRHRFDNEQKSQQLMLDSVTITSPGLLLLLLRARIILLLQVRLVGATITMAALVPPMPGAAPM